MEAMQMQPSPSLYITGLPLEISSEQLQAVFAQYGGVTSAQALELLPGAVDRNGLVEMKSLDEATWLIQNLNGNIPACLQTPVGVQFLAGAGGGAAAPAPSPVMAAMSGAGFGGGGGLGGGGGMAFGGMGGGGGVGPGGAPPMGVTLNGKVKRWDCAKGFGFLIPEGGGSDVFIHATELTDGEMLVEGAAVSFVCEPDAQKGGRFRAKMCTGAIPKASAPAPAASSPNDNLFIAGLPIDFNEEQIKTTFSQYGTVISVKKLPVQPGKNDCAALVRMNSCDQAQWLVENVNQNIPNGLTAKCTVRFAESKPGKGKGKGGPMGEMLPMGLQSGGFGVSSSPSFNMSSPGPYGGGVSAAQDYLAQQMQNLGGQQGGQAPQAAIGAL